LVARYHTYIIGSLWAAVKGVDISAYSAYIIGMPQKKRRKPAADRKQCEVRVLLTPQDKKALLAAAKRARLPLSTWLRITALGAADEGG